MHFFQDKQLRRSYDSRRHLLAASASTTTAGGFSSGSRQGSLHSLDEYGGNNAPSSATGSTVNGGRPRVIYSQSFSDGLAAPQAQTWQRPQRQNGVRDRPEMAPLAAFDEDTADGRLLRPVRGTLARPQKRYHLPPPPPLSDSQSDIVACRTGSGESDDAGSLLLPDQSGSEVGEPVRRPFSVQGTYTPRAGARPRSLQPHHLHHRHSRGGYLPMEPVFPASSQLPHPTLHTLPQRPSMMTPSRSFPVPPQAFSYRPPPPPAMSSFRPPTKEEIERDVQFVLQSMGIDNNGRGDEGN